MAQPYIGELRIFAGTFEPVGWAFCDGRLLPISENDALFALLGTTYGGDGQETFGLPDLRGRLPLHQGNGFTLAESGGAETVTLTTNHMPAHSHPLRAADRRGDQASPAGNVPAQSYNVTPYVNDVAGGNFAVNTFGGAGGSQPHENRQPFLCLNFIISLFGIYPSAT